MSGGPYRGRLAPSPTGYMHLGHAATFWLAQERCRQRGGSLILRIEDLDRERCRPEYVGSLLADLRWYGLDWDEGPDTGGAAGPYAQSERQEFYLDAWRSLAARGMVYACTCTRRDVERAVRAPHAGEQEPIYPGTCRPPQPLPVSADGPGNMNWRFRTMPGEAVVFQDGRAGCQEYTAGKNFGDYLVWRKDGVPAYTLAVVVDDATMGITEVVRGEDLLAATAQQILLYRALGRPTPAFYHAPLVCGANGQRLAKRAGSHSLRALREAGIDPATLRPAPGPV